MRKALFVTVLEFDVACARQVVWGWICPGLCLLLVIVSITPPFGKLDVMDALSSKPFPEGTEPTEPSVVQFTTCARNRLFSLLDDSSWMDHCFTAHRCHGCDVLGSESGDGQSVLGQFGRLLSRSLLPGQTFLKQVGAVVQQSSTTYPSES